MEKIELNLNNPIFVFYVDISNMPADRANETLMHYHNIFDIYSNITTWIVATDHTKVECVYDGGVNNRNMEISHIIKEINKRVEILSNSSNFDDFKMNVRNWRLNEIIENGTHEK